MTDHSDGWSSKHLVWRHDSVKGNVRQGVDDCAGGAGDDNGQGKVSLGVLELLHDEVEVIPSLVGKETGVEGQWNVSEVTRRSFPNVFKGISVHRLSYRFQKIKYEGKELPKIINPIPLPMMRIRAKTFAKVKKSMTKVATLTEIQFIAVSNTERTIQQNKLKPYLGVWLPQVGWLHWEGRSLGRMVSACRLQMSMQRLLQCTAWKNVFKHNYWYFLT